MLLLGLIPENIEQTNIIKTQNVEHTRVSRTQNTDIPTL
jgi:hypothetical protein